MQSARDEVATSVGATDVDNGSILKPVLPEANDALSRFVLQRVEGFVDNEPARLMQQDTREDQALLLVTGEFPLPARDTAERRGKAIQACALERSY